MTSHSQLRSERPKTSHSIHRLNNHSISAVGGGLGIDRSGTHTDKDMNTSTLEKEKSLDDRNGGAYARSQLQHIEETKKKTHQRPMSGGLQKIKTESQRSRINKMNQNFSMYDKFGASSGNQNGLSPDKNMNQFSSLNSNPHHNNSKSSGVTAGSSVFGAGSQYQAS